MLHFFKEHAHTSRLEREWILDIVSDLNYDSMPKNGLFKLSSEINIVLDIYSPQPIMSMGLIWYVFKFSEF